MQSEKLAQAIILQAMDDLYDTREQVESVNFFTGPGFYECALMGSMDYNEMQGLLEIVCNIVTGPPVRRSSRSCQSPRDGVYGTGRNCKAH